MAVSIAKVKKGDTVMYCLFTGMKVGPKEVTACDKNTVTICRKGLGDVTFDRKTGRQVSPMPKKERFASFITEDDGTFVHPMHKEKNKKRKAKGTKEEAEETPIKKTKKAKATKATKATPPPRPKPAPKPEPEEDDEEWDDDDFEEVE